MESSPKERAKELKRLFHNSEENREVTHQRLIINKLKEYGTVSEYENEVLKLLKG
ncbi:MAG: hypothetical protein HRT87_01310 [Legionellales bacterium]|nr:hypothetical protein [Legionellales bacterium]